MAGHSVYRLRRIAGLLWQHATQSDSAHQMHVQMQDLLVGVLTTVDQQAVAIVGDTFAPGEVSGNDKHVPQCCFIRFGDVVNSRYDLVWNDQDVCGRLRIDVPKSGYTVILKNDVSG